METCLTILAAILLVASHCHGTVILKPSILIFDENVTVTPFTVTCEIPSALTNTKINAVYIDRNAVRLGEATSKSTLKHISGTSINGNISKSITLNMPQASCWDGGEYSCTIIYTTGNNLLKSFTASQTLNVVVKPGRKVTMIASPNKPGYSLNDVVHLSCSGLIGDKSVLSEIQWIWEYLSYHQNSTWIKYNDSEIINDPPMTINDTCQNRQVSNMFRTLNLGDNRRTYRCYITWQGIIYTDNSSTYLFTFAYETGKIYWMIGVAVVGGIILCVAIQFFIIYLRHSQIKIDEEGSSEDTKVQSVHEDEISGPLASRDNLRMKTLHNMVVIHEPDRHSLNTETASELASSKGSVSSQGTLSIL